MRRFTILLYIIALGFLYAGCDKSKPQKTILQTAPEMTTDSSKRGNISFKVSFAPWKNVFSAKIAGVESINKVTAYVYKSDDTEITNKNLTIESGRAQGNIDVTAQSNLKVVLVYFEDTTVRWIGEDTDVDVEAGKETTAEIVEHFMGTSVSAPDTANTGESYEISCMSLLYAIGYQFQEASSINFSDAVTFDEADTTRTISAKTEAGMYYYRARAQTKFGYGPWYTTGDASTGIVDGTGTIIIDVPIPSDTPLTGKIAFEHSSDIYVMAPDGYNKIRLTSSSIDNRFPSWSPDGSQIAFQSQRDGNWEIYIMDSDGSNQTNITNASREDQYPSWSPDGSKIAFSSWRDSNWEIYVMNADGSNQTRLTDNRLSDIQPSWSHDGSKIAFVYNNDIYIMDADGSNQTNITNESRGNRFPSWSPDGSQIAFSYEKDANNWEIYVMNTDGTNYARLTDNSYNEYHPSWSPDGSQIVFHSDRDGENIYVMDADGSNQTNITNNTSNIDPSWSPF